MTGIRNMRADVAFLAALSAAHPMHAAQLLAAGAGIFHRAGGESVRQKGGCYT